MSAKFENMSVDEAIDYCYEHEHEYKMWFGPGENPNRAFLCLIDGLEEGYILPSELSDYGME